MDDEIKHNFNVLYIYFVLFTLNKKRKGFYMVLGFSKVLIIIHVAAVTTAENGRRALEILGLGDNQHNTLEGRVSCSEKRDIIMNFLIPFTYWTLSNPDFFPYKENKYSEHFQLRLEMSQ